MDQLFSLYFPHLIAGLMVLFLLVLGVLSIEDALSGRKN